MEVNARTSAIAQPLGELKYRFNQPMAIAISGNRARIANFTGRSVTELSIPNGRLIRILPKN